PRALRPLPVDSIAGVGARGAGILAGRFVLAGQAIAVRPLDAAARPPGARFVQRLDWAPAGASAAWLAAFHGFGWLRDLAAVGSPEAQRLARDLVCDWIIGHESWTPLAWAPEILGARLSAWVGHQAFLCEGADPAFRAQMFGSLARQSRHLARCLPSDVVGSDLLTAIKGLVLASLALPSGGDRAARGLALLETEIKAQVLPDGGHVERSPAAQMEALRHLVDIRAALGTAGEEAPSALRTAIDRLAPMLRFFRHGDGRLCLFNGTRAEDAAQLDRLLADADARGKPPPQAPHSGFQRLQSGRSVLLLDCGMIPRQGLDQRTHAGSLSFELSNGRDRVIVNCGAHLGASATWRRVERATAAHSTLVVDDTNSAEVQAEGGIGRRPRLVVCQREQAEGCTWLDASHDGYRQSHGLIHRRRLFLSSDGDDLRGEDILAGSGGRAYALRFHLHPSVQTTTTHGGKAVLMRAPSGAGWRFRAADGTTEIADSIYLGDDGEPTKCRQVVVTGALRGSGARIRWALQREGR
ncbi:MAG: heparinase II/III family protein, partial [Alphaproteobacteria bacterium]|nr:heparinase II/III family protein [Alphaproteobacteria bacterium]